MMINFAWQPPGTVYARPMLKIGNSFGREQPAARTGLAVCGLVVAVGLACEAFGVIDFAELFGSASSLILGGGAGIVGILAGFAAGDDGRDECPVGEGPAPG